MLIKSECLELNASVYVRLHSIPDLIELGKKEEMILSAVIARST